jgi:Flp pilus assembly pilin Flp
MWRRAWNADFSGMPSCRRREEGQTMSEYAAVLAVITPLIILGYAALSGAIQAAIDTARSFL